MTGADRQSPSSHGEGSISTSRSPRDWTQKLLAIRKALELTQCWLVVAFAVSLSLPITFPWIVLIAGMAVLAILAVLEAVLARHAVLPAVQARPSFLLSPLAVPLAAFAVAAYLSGVLAPERGGIKEGLQSIWSLKALLVYFWAHQAFKRMAKTDEKRPFLAAAVCAMLSMGALAGLFGAFQQITGIHPTTFKYLQGTGFLSGPMAFAGQMQIFSMLSLSLVLSDGRKDLKQPWDKIIFPVAAANLLGLLFACERSAWLGGICGVMAVASMVSWRMALKVLLGLMLFGAIVWLTVPVVQTRIAPLLTNWQSDPSARVRMIVWRESFRSFKQHPVTGTGLRKFVPIRGEQVSAFVPAGKGYIDHAHSNYLHVLSTTGALGFAAYAWLMGAALIVSFRQARAPRTTADAFWRATGVGVFAATVSLMVAGIFEYNFGTGQIRLTQWFVLALVGIICLDSSSSLQSVSRE